MLSRLTQTFPDDLAEAMSASEALLLGAGAVFLVDDFAGAAAGAAMAEPEAGAAAAGAAAGFAAGAVAGFAAGAAIEFAAGALAGAIVESAFLLFFDEVLLEAASVEEAFAAGAAVLVPEAAGAAVPSVLAAAFFDFFDFLAVVVD